MRNSNPKGHTVKHRAIRTSRGFTYVGLLAILVIIGISLGAAGKYWQNIILRDKEAELLFRGDQYKEAIERYYNAIPFNPQLPRRIEDLLVDNRTSAGKRHLRQKYKDPMTGEDFVLVEGVNATGKYIIGVHSKSDKTPLKQSHFPEVHQDFEGKGQYSDWQFIATIPQSQEEPEIPTPSHLPPRRTPPPQNIK
ncbi:MAG TPA: type II secretion system protein [Nitrospirota bacterium]|nr:type II secretion system protein [Nitrospirota bacterium]